MEAILDFGRGCQNLSIILWGERVEGVAEMARRPAAPVITFEGGSERGGGRGEGGEREEKTCPCTVVLNAAICI
jgi:hypothetical protein